MVEQFIKGITIFWDKIERYSYLREIEALRNLDYLELHKPVTFLVGAYVIIRLS